MFESRMCGLCQSDCDISIVDEVVRWHHRLDGHEFEQAQGVGDGHGSLACCSQPMALQSQTWLSD